MRYYPPSPIPFPHVSRREGENGDGFQVLPTLWGKDLGWGAGVASPAG